MNHLKSLAPYRKTIVAVVLGVLQFLALYFTLEENGISSEDKVALVTNIIVAIGGAGAVYAVPNDKVVK